MKVVARFAKQETAQAQMLADKEAAQQERDFAVLHRQARVPCVARGAASVFFVSCGLVARCRVLGTQALARAKCIGSLDARNQGATMR